MVNAKSQATKVSKKLQGWIPKTLRCILGLILVATGTGKALDIRGFTEVLAAYDILPAWGNVILSFLLPVVELTVGAALITGFFLPIAAWGAVGLHAMLLASVSISLWRGLKISNCGCFGVFWPRPMGIQTLVEDAVMLGLSLLVLWQARRAA